MPPPPPRWRRSAPRARSPPARPASKARRRHGKASRSGVSNVSCDSSVQSMAPNASAAGPAHRGRARSAGACRASRAGRWWRRRRTRPCCGSTDCGCTTTSIRSNGDAEQLVGLDHLEALVHQRRRVDRDLGAHVPGGVAAARRSTVTAASCSRREPRNGPPLAVSTSLLDLGGAARPAGTGRAPSARCRRGRSRRPPVADRGRPPGRRR